MQRRSLETILAEHPFFRGLDPEYLELLGSCASNVRFAAGEVIFREGDPADNFYLLRHGHIALEVFTPDRGALNVATLGEGDVLGWSWLFPPYKWLFDVRTVELTRAIALDGTCLRGKCDEDPRLGYDLMKRFAQIMVERLLATRLQLLDLYSPHVTT
ncbi:MAG: cyclic nucleotide-binding domain-containing protein [Dehalococcoidia bacterium]